MKTPDDTLGLRHRTLRLARRLRQALAQLVRVPTAQGLSLGELLDLHGVASLGAALLFWALFSQLPVGGVGNVAALALWALSWDWWRGHGHLRCPQRLSRCRIGMKSSQWLLRVLASCYRRAGRWIKPRWPVLCQSAAARQAWAVWVAMQALLIFLPVPLGNVLPGLSLAALGLGQLAQDGAMHLLSLVLGVAAVGYVLWLGDLLLNALAWLPFF